MELKNLLMYLFLTLFLYFSFNISHSTSQSILSGNVLNADDYSSIQEAVDALPNEGGTVFIPTGIYKISEPIVVTKSDVTLMGAGAGTLLLNINEEGKNSIELKGKPGRGNRIWRVKVSNMHLKGNENCGHAICAHSVNEISLNDMWIDYHGKTGLYLDDCYEDPRIFDNNITYNKGNGIYLEGCHDIVVSANQLEENGIGIYAKDVWNAGVTGNSVDDHIHYSVYFEHTIGSIISANMFENSIKECIILSEKCQGITVTGNVFRYSGKKLLHIINSKGISVAGNTFEAEDGCSIEIEKGSNLITISGNVLFGARQNSERGSGMEYGIIMKDIFDISISGNTIVKPLEGGIYILGCENKYLTITGNTIKNPSAKSTKNFSGILLNNTLHSIISFNTIIDDRSKILMKSAIEETGNSDYNVITGNRINRGTLNDIVITGKNTRKEGNFVY